MPSRAALAVLTPVAIASALLLTACAVPAPESTGSPSAPSGTPSMTADPTDQPTASGDAVPVDIACAELVSPDAMYAFNPNFSLLDVWDPEEGTPAASARGFAGTACRWVNDTSGETIEITVAQPSEADLAEIRAQASTGEALTVPGTDAAFFAVSGGVGTVSAFEGDYWATVRSPWFLGATDAQVIIDEVAASL